MSDTSRKLDEILGRHSVHFNYSKAETKAKLSVLIEEAERLARIDELQVLQILDFEPDEPEIEAKYPTQSFDEYIDDRLASLEQKGRV